MLKNIAGLSITSWRISVSTGAGVEGGREGAGRKEKEKKKKEDWKTPSDFTGSYFTSKTVTDSQLVTLLAFPPPPYTELFLFSIKISCPTCSCTLPLFPRAGAGADRPQWRQQPPSPGKDQHLQQVTSTDITACTALHQSSSGNSQLQ